VQNLSRENEFSLQDDKKKKKHFHINGLTLKQRLRATWKWTITLKLSPTCPKWCHHWWMIDWLWLKRGDL